MSDEVMDLRQVVGLAERLANIPKKFQGRIRPLLRAAGGDMLRDAQVNASWSSRIPASLSLRVTLNGTRPGIALRASLRVAPHARAYEGILGDAFKHPLFGDDGEWFEQRARPYALPAVQAQSERIVEELTRIVDAVNAEAGLT